MDPINTRRYPRYRMHTPVFIGIPGGSSRVVPGLVSKISRAGMEVYAGVNLQPGELMEIEFRATGRTIRIAGTVRNRSFFCFGVEFFAAWIEREKMGRDREKLEQEKTERQRQGRTGKDVRPWPT